MTTSTCTTGFLHSVKNVVLVQKEATLKKMLLKSGTGGLTMSEYIESNRKHEFNPNGKDKGGEM